MPRRKTPAPPAAQARPETPTVSESGAAPSPKKPRPRAARAATAQGVSRAARKPAARAEEPAPDALGASLARLERVAARFESGCDSLARALDEMPRPDDFQPLADHLYEFARSAPQLVESLQEVPRAAGPIQESVRALEQLAETLHFTHESFNESLLRLPRAEDYEPLFAPLGEFARVSPALRESLAEVLRVARPLGAAVQDMEGVSRELRATERRLSDALAATAVRARAAPGATAGGEASRVVVRDAAACMQAARQAILDALATLPREPAYAALARQLRELATVSPSLMDWLRQTPALVAPLTSSVAALQAAAVRLDEGRALLLAALGTAADDEG